jgi:NADH-quinone oxidoreductase subunit A
MITALLIFIVAAMSLGGIITALVLILGQEVPSVEKVSSYEFGFEPFGDARDNFDVTFYLVGLLFLIFDVEIAFLFP